MFMVKHKSAAIWIKVYPFKKLNLFWFIFYNAKPPKMFMVKHESAEILL